MLSTLAWEYGQRTSAAQAMLGSSKSSVYLPRPSALSMDSRRGVVDNVEMMLFHHCCAPFPFAYWSMTLEAATMASSIFV